MKNANKKRKNENFEKQKNAFFLMSQGSFDKKNHRSKGVVCSPRADKQTDSQTPK